MTDIELLAAIVRGDRDIVASLSSVDAEAFCRRAAEHGVLPLVAERLAHGEYVPAALRTLLRTRETDAIVLDLARVAELKQLLRALARGGVLPLLLKGAHLAYSHYARPYLRPKSDTDLLVPPHARDAVRRIVLDLGYDAPTRRIGRGHEVAAVVKDQSAQERASLESAMRKSGSICASAPQARQHR